MGNCDYYRNSILFSGDVERGVGEPTVPPTTPSLSIRGNRGFPLFLLISRCILLG